MHVPGPVDLVLHFASPASPLDYLKMPIETLEAGSLGTLRTPGFFIDLRVDDPKVRRPDTARGEQLLGWRPSVTSEEGLRATVAWFAEVLGRRNAAAG